MSSNKIEPTPLFFTLFTRVFFVAILFDIYFLKCAVGILNDVDSLNRSGETQAVDGVDTHDGTVAFGSNAHNSCCVCSFIDTASNVGTLPLLKLLTIIPFNCLLSFDILSYVRIGGIGSYHLFHRHAYLCYNCA